MARQFLRTLVLMAMLAGLSEMLARTAEARRLGPAGGFGGGCRANPAAWVMADLFLFPCYFTVMRWLKNRLLLTGQLTQSPKEYSAHSTASH